MTRTVAAWALFDLANTFFAVAMLSFHFPLWIVEDQGVPELAFGVALGASMACVALLMPFAGALSDLTGERMRYVRWTTYGCVIATLLVSLTREVSAALLLFALANVCYQLGTVFYDALLWSVAPAGRMGESSGIGSACGYLGSAVGLLCLWPFLRSGGHQAALAPSAAWFLLLALPSFFLVRDPQPASRVAWKVLVRAAARRLASTLRSARALPGLSRYFGAAFFSSSAINTVLVFMGVYAKRVMGLREAEMIRFFVASQLCAVAGALILTRLIPRLGARRLLSWIWGGWVAALGLATITVSPAWMWVAGPLIGFCLGATWSTSRVLVIELSPKDQLAQMLGLTGLVVKVASILGPVLWGLLVQEPGRYRHAVGVLAAFLGVALWLLQGVPNMRGGQAGGAHATV